MITFKECQSPGYRARTMINASADITIAIAKDFTTAGERLTKSCVLLQHKLYLPIDDDNINYSASMFGIDVKADNNIIANTAARMTQLRKPEVSINIAGNGIYTFQEPQHVIDLKVYCVLAGIIIKLDKSNIKITLIRSGGQTGIDEAGLKAAVKLGIPALCLAPKGWIFRDINGKDISNEEQFKARFK